MKTKQIATKYNINQGSFDRFLKKTGQEYSTNFWGDEFSVKDEDVERIVEKYNNWMANIEAQKNEEERQKELQIKQAEERMKELREALPKILVTSGYNFEGYRIVKYSGYISGDDAVQVSRGFDGWIASATDVGTELMKSLTVIRRNALKELKEAAYDLGCNAIIGVDFDYMTLDPQTANATGGTTYLPYVFGVTANGTAVKIEKIED